MRRLFLLLIILIAIVIFISIRNTKYTDSIHLVPEDGLIQQGSVSRTISNTTIASPRNGGFTSLKIPIVIFCSYRYQYMSRLIRSLHDIDGLNVNSTCLFACQRSSSVREEDVTKTMKLIEDVKFCKTKTLFAQSKRRNAKEYKQQWYNTVKQAFEGKGIVSSS